MNSETEAWRPPLFASGSGVIPRLLAATRRFFDIQAGSIWRDLNPILKSVEGTVVDVGCGAQPYRRLLPSNAIYMGIDTAASKSHFGYEVPDTLYFSGDTWPIPDESADVILCTETMEHVFDTRQFLGEISRCLSPGGLFVGTVPFSARWHFIPHDYWRFTPSTLRRLFEEAGFHQIGIFARGNETTVAAYKAMALIVKCLMPQHTSPIHAIFENAKGADACRQSGEEHRQSSGGALNTVPVLRVIFKRIIGLCLFPVFLLLAVIANISLRSAGGDDCLGYTILAMRQRDPES